VRREVFPHRAPEHAGALAVHNVQPVVPGLQRGDDRIVKPVDCFVREEPV